MFYELFLIMIFGFILYHFYINTINYLNTGAPFIEEMSNSKQKKDGEEKLNVEGDFDDNTYSKLSKKEKKIENELVNKEIITEVLKNKKLIIAGSNIKTFNYDTNINIGKRFLSEMSIVRNLALPKNIYDSEYAVVGQNVINLVNNRKNRHEKKLISNIRKMLSGTKLASSNVDGSTQSCVATHKRTTGLFNDRCNRLIKTKKALCKKINEECSPNMKKGLRGETGKYTNSYKPTDDADIPQPYDSVWG